MAKKIGRVEQTLRNGVKASDAGKLDGAGTRKVTPDEMELSRLRTEVIRLKRKVDI